MDALSVLRSLDHQKQDKYQQILAARHDTIEFYAFAATPAGVLSPRTHDVISTRARQRADIAGIPEREMERILVTQVTSAIQHFVAHNILLYGAGHLGDKSRE